MSRICVKNLPKYLGEDRLREYFSQKGEVTDAKLMRTRDGKSRQFAFIGFRTEGEADDAINFFNNSYMDTCKITCEVARKIGDPNIPRPWSRYTAKKDGKESEKNKETEGIRDETPTLPTSREKNSKSADADPQFQEFLEIMQPRVKSKLWANDTLEASVFFDKNGTTDDGGAHPLKGYKKKPSQMQPETLEGEETLRIKKLPEFTQDDAVSDMDYFKSRVKENWVDSEADDDEILGEEIREPVAEKGHPFHSEEAQKHAGGLQNDTNEVSLGHSNGVTIDTETPSSAISDENDQALDTGRLFVRNLPYTTSEDELLELFGNYGDVSDVHLVVDKDTKRSKGLCYVLYTLPESAVRALEELDNSIFQGRLLHVMPAKPQIQSAKKLEPDFIVGQSTKSFKLQREEQRKASEVSGDTRAWNSLFMRPDTVVENVSRKYGISKSDLLDREADDLAVRIALGETHVIAETKKALLSSGVNTASLEELATKKIDNTKRNNHVILVKNLPYSSCEGDLTEMFGKFGGLDKIILPPTKALALVIFLEAAEARAAFKGLAYKRYKDAPLYLEWAPKDILNVNLTSQTSDQNVVGKQDVKRVLVEQSMEGVPEVDVDPDRVESRSLFVKNLNFKTSEEALKNHFNDNLKNRRILSVKVMKHNKNGKNVSMGYGFLEFDSVETANDVSRDLQGTILEGHALILQLCHAKKDGTALKKVEKDKSSTKLLVKNVAFEATKKDLRQLFSPFGQIKSLRLPMKFGRHRGFAFVEYVTKQEAKNAEQALSSTHLYGRHLVLERAKEGESLDELQARTAAQFTDKQNGHQNLSKKRHNMSIVDEGKIKFQRIMD